MTERATRADEKRHLGVGQLSGNSITIRDNDVSAISRTDDDVDAIRFFGDHITLSHNRAHDVWANPAAGGHLHVESVIEAYQAAS